MRLSKLLAAIGLCVAAAPAQASQSAYGYVYGFQTLSSGVVLFQTTGARSGAPSCQNVNYPKRWAFDSTTATGQATLSIVLTAYALQKTILIVGTGNCSILGDNETLSATSTDNV